jgi:hypothetical protein
MKNVYTFAIVSLIFTLSQSCSIDKRMHRNGYHISWNSRASSANTTNKIPISKNEEDIFHKQTQDISASTSCISAVEIANPKVQLVHQIKYKDSTTRSHVKHQQISKPTVNRLQIGKRIHQHKKDEKINQIIHKATTIVKRLPTKSNSFDNTTKSKTPPVGLGLFLLGISMMIAFGFSMPIGIILGGLSVLLILAIIITKALSPSGHIDVIYFKNGNIIRGQIIEQIPNVSLKIKTSDGSIYVHKFEEIEKIVSEEI